MTLWARWVAMLIVPVALLAADANPSETYRARRCTLLSKHPDGVILLYGYGEYEGQSARSPFRQENNFYYLTGWNEPGAAMLLHGDCRDEKNHAEILFLPSRKPSHEKWVGPRTGPSDPELTAKTGFRDVRESTELDRVMNSKLETWRRLYTLLPRNHASHGQQPEPDRKSLLEKLAPDYPKLDVRPALEAMRMIKSEGEIRLIQKAIDATIAGHRAAWSRVRPGLFEYQVMAAMIGPIMDRGCIRMAYAPIIGSGFNATVLHYAELMGRLSAGDLVLMDVGGEYGHYAADITRTVPGSGRFTARQREVYDAVLGAQKAAIQAVKPGMTLSGSGSHSLEQVVRKYLDSLAKDRKGGPLSRYLGHGLGHHVGLEVHDPGSGSEKLLPGMVITIEPGLYLPEEKFGVRIEDMLLVTETGARVLSDGLPSEAAEIESILSPPTSVSSGL